MKKEGFVLPAREYYDLERAARYIGHGCEVGDILHWAEIDAIKLAVKFEVGSGCPAHVVFDETPETVAEKLTDMCDLDDFWILISRHSIFNSHQLIEAGDISEVVDIMMRSSDLPSILGYLQGVWDIDRLVIDSSKSRKFSARSFSPVGNTAFKVKAYCNEEDREFSEDNLLISKENIGIILGMTPNGLLNPNSSLIKKNYKEEASDVVIRNRAALIKSFIGMVYGEDVANNPRQHFDNPQSALRCDFESKGYKLPTGKTVANWLKGIEIEKE